MNKPIFPSPGRSVRDVMRDAHRPGTIRADHHWVLDYFPPQPRLEKAGHQTSFLGDTFPGRFAEGVQIFPTDRLIPPLYPTIESEYFELTDLLEAALDAKSTFTFIEAGAGYGRWSARAALAAERIGLSAHVIMIEGDPTHASWAREMMELNGIKNFTLIEAAVAARRGAAPFLISAPGFVGPSAWYGQSLVSSTGLTAAAFVESEMVYKDKLVSANGEWCAIEVPTVTLEDAIADHEHIDLIDMDIQGAEGEVIAASLDLLTRRARRLCIETHSVDIECDLRRILDEAGWTLLRDLPANTTTKTPFGSITMPGGGLQSWLNPRLY